MGKLVLLLLLPLLSCSQQIPVSSRIDYGPVMDEQQAARLYAHGDVSPRYSWLQDHVFPLCNYCHPRKRANFLSYEGVLQVVVPGHPEASLLYQKLASGQMPPGGQHLSAEKIQAIYDWIRLGANKD
jgi:hypothetical protein